MNGIEQDIKELEKELVNVIERFEKEHGLLVTKIEYDGYNKRASYTFV